jgi:hypothetical protein
VYLTFSFVLSIDLCGSWSGDFDFAYCQFSFLSSLSRSIGPDFCCDLISFTVAAGLDLAFSPLAPSVTLVWFCIHRPSFVFDLGLSVLLAGLRAPARNPVRI